MLGDTSGRHLWETPLGVVLSERKDMSVLGSNVNEIKQ